MNRAFDVVTLIVGVAAIMVLVRPGSQGPKLVQAVGDAFTGALATASGSGVPKGYQATAWSNRSN